MSNQFTDYWGTLQLNNDLRGGQLLLASQLYDTHFSIFGSFTITKTEENSCFIEGVKLQIINFKGPTQLGFVENQTQKLSKEDKIIRLNLDLKAISSGNAVSTLNLNFDNKINCSTGDGIEFIRNLLPMSTTNEPIVNGVFDSEFYYRDGLRYASKIVREFNDSGEIDNPIANGQNIQIGNITANAPWLKGDEVGFLGPGKLCRKGQFNIIVN